MSKGKRCESTLLVGCVCLVCLLHEVHSALRQREHVNELAPWQLEQAPSADAATLWSSKLTPRANNVLRMLFLNLRTC